MCLANRNTLWFAILIIVAGVAKLLDNLGYWNVHFARLWPLWLIAAGFAMLAGRSRGRFPAAGGESHE